MEKETYSFPRGPMTLGAAAEEAKRALAADYAADVNGVCAAIKAKVKGGLVASGMAKAIEELVEKSPRVRMTTKAMWGVLVSKNLDQLSDESFELEDDGIPWRSAMSFLMCLDVVDQLDVDGVDVSGVDFDFEDDEDEDEDEESDD
jgi:hypothetical protein